MISISLCMIVRDEEETLGRCLDTVKGIADEIIIVDTGSADRTKEIAAKYTSKIYDFKWVDDFAAARNYSFSKATRDYILWLDADDVLLKEDQAKLKLLKEQIDPSIDMVIMNYYLGLDVMGKPMSTAHRERLFKRSRNYQWQDPVHEYIKLEGRIVSSEAAVTHLKLKKMTQRNLNILDKAVKQGKALSHRMEFYYAKELYINGRYEEAKLYYERYLNTVGDLSSNYIDACTDLSKIFKAEGDEKNSVRSLIKYFELGIPRAEICCELGSYYKDKKQYERAIGWYKTATRISKPQNTLETVIHDCYDYIPFVEISICFFNMGLIKEAVEYNIKAMNLKPDSSVVQQNKRYFETIIESVKQML